MIATIPIAVTIGWNKEKNPMIRLNVPRAKIHPQLGRENSLAANAPMIRSTPEKIIQKANINVKVAVPVTISNIRINPISAVKIPSASNQPEGFRCFLSEKYAII